MQRHHQSLFNKPVIVLFGKEGQLGHELFTQLNPVNNLIAFSHAECDICDVQHVTTIINQYRPNIIINATAYTNVDQAEIDIETAYQINHHSVQHLATLAKQIDSLLIHYSTDYVFDGTITTSYQETDQANPLSIYGKSKLAGENAIITSNCDYFIFRTSWIYSQSKKNFLTTILKLATEESTLSIVNDQIGTPNSAKQITTTTIDCLQQYLLSNDKNLLGLYHLSCAGSTSWFEYAKFIISQAKKFGLPLQLQAENIQSISSAAYPQRATRPKNSSLNNQKLATTFNLELPHWAHNLEKTIQQLSTTHQRKHHEIKPS
jgi:dTDP-4-dehydrorhamnose reductase